MQRPYRRSLLAIFLAILVLGGIVFLLHSQHASSTPQNNALLQALWRSYKQQSWDKNSGRTIDHANGDVTTSEGQGYTMLRAVWENDQPVFIKTWQWTATHLQRTDKLFSWRYGVQTAGSMGILADQGGQNTASDADTDIALALILARVRWNNLGYLASARDIVRAVWSQEVVTIRGKPYLVADNLEHLKTTDAILLNPSYFSPYAYRIFARLDPGHNWASLTASSYALIQQAAQAPLNSRASVDLPPDWVTLNRQTGQLQLAPNQAQGTDFGYNALRTVWRTALDWQWFHTATAQQSLQQYGFLDDQWNQHQKLLAIYHHDGKPAATYESIALYGGTLSYFQYQHPTTAKTMLANKLAPLYDAKTGQLKQPLSYYDNNWAWFGVALYNNQLPNVTEGVSL